MFGLGANRTKRVIMYNHNCEKCVSLGTCENYDLYVCPQHANCTEPVSVIRYNNNPNSTYIHSLDETLSTEYYESVTDFYKKVLTHYYLKLQEHQREQPTLESIKKEILAATNIHSLVSRLGDPLGQEIKDHLKELAKLHEVDEQFTHANFDCLIELIQTIKGENPMQELAKKVSIHLLKLMKYYAVPSEA